MEQIALRLTVVDFVEDFLGDIWPDWLKVTARSDFRNLNANGEQSGRALQAVSDQTQHHEKPRLAQTSICEIRGKRR
jgi:hypothetical protein